MDDYPYEIRESVSANGLQHRKIGRLAYLNHANCLAQMICGVDAKIVDMNPDWTMCFENQLYRVWVVKL